MKNKFAITYISWVISLSLYIWFCSLASNTEEQFLFLLSFGTMVSMLVFCTILMFLSEKLD